MNQELDCGICFGTGTLVKTSESNCLSCLSTPRLSCAICAGFGVIRAQKSIACEHCPDGSRHTPRSMTVELVSPRSLSRRKSPSVSINELALLVALTTSAFSSLLFLMNTNNVGLVLTFFVFTFIALYTALKTLIRKAKAEGGFFTTFVYGGLLAAFTASLPPLLGM